MELRNNSIEDIHHTEKLEEKAQAELKELFDQLFLAETRENIKELKTQLDGLKVSVNNFITESQALFKNTSSLIQQLSDKYNSSDEKMNEYHTKSNLAFTNLNNMIIKIRNISIVVVLVLIILIFIK